MHLDTVLSNAASGLDSINKQLSVLAQNVANASTPGYTRETVALASVEAGGDPMGVRVGVATRTVDAALQANLLSSTGQVAGDTVRDQALSSIDAASGAPGSGQDLASLVGALRDGFSTLASDPANQTQQRQVVNLAASVGGGVNTLGQAVGGARQQAQNGLVADVATANTALATIGKLSDQIIAAQARGETTADLSDKRDAAITTVTELTGAKFLPQPNGDVLAVSGGTVLPIRAASGPLAIAPATVSGDTPSSALPKLTVSGNPVTITAGRIGAELDLRDNVLPGLQSKLDDFSQALATGFAGQGLTLFTDSTGTIPASGTAGFAQTIQVNPAVTATPSMVRDGAGSGGVAGDTTLINALLTNVLASGRGTIAGMATDLVANQASLASEAASKLATNTAVQTSLSTKLQAGTGVSVDTEMSRMVALQNSYGANARVVSTVQAMWNQLLSSVQ